jgi:hypothetical protein
VAPRIISLAKKVMRAHAGVTGYLQQFAGRIGKI